MEERDVKVPDPFGGRQPTSHERMAGLPWDASYQDGPAPWDIGEPQPALLALASSNGFVGPVLDVGCGTGENALYVASLGIDVVGVDVAETALAMARTKAAARGIGAEFWLADALHLETLGQKFATVLDCGLFHSLDGDERSRYVKSLAAAIDHGGTLHVLCFSDIGPDPGPHPVREEELVKAFRAHDGWAAPAVHPVQMEWNVPSQDPHPVRQASPAWLATIKRV